MALSSMSVSSLLNKPLLWRVCTCILGHCTNLLDQEKEIKIAGWAERQNAFSCMNPFGYCTNPLSHYTKSALPLRLLRLVRSSTSPSHCTNLLVQISWTWSRSIELELCSCCRTYIAALPILLWSRSRWPLHETPWPLHETPWPLHETPWGADTSVTTHAPWWDKSTNVYMWNDHWQGRLLQDLKRRTSPADWRQDLYGFHKWWWFGRNAPWKCNGESTSGTLCLQICVWSYPCSSPSLL